MKLAGDIADSSLGELQLDFMNAGIARESDETILVTLGLSKSLQGVDRFDPVVLTGKVDNVSFQTGLLYQNA